MRRPWPEMVEWELTRACDLRCGHCYNGPPRSRRAELSRDQALALARRLAQGGCRSVTLSGGEPTLRTDWADIAETLTDAGVGVQLFSNGQRIDAAVAAAAARAGVRMVLLSLDGIGPIHDRLRGRRGAYDKVLRAARLLAEHGVPVGFNSVLLRANLSQLEALGETVMSLDAALWTVWRGIRVSVEDIWLDGDAARRLAPRLRALSRSFPVLRTGDNLSTAFGCGSLRQQPGCRGAAPAGCPAGCPAGDRVMAVRSDGGLVGCLALPAPPAQREGCTATLEQAWQRVLEERQTRQRRILASCAGCSQLAACGGGCHATALAEGLDRSACHRRARPDRSRPARALTSAATSLLLASAAGCNSRPAANDSTAPSQPSNAVEVIVPPVMSASADSEPPPPTAPSKSAAAAASEPSASGVFVPLPSDTGPGGMPRCCRMHILVPDCQCGGPAVPPSALPNKP